MKLTLKQIAKAKPNPIFKGLAKTLKDTKNFNNTEKKLQDIIKSEHKHKQIKDYVNCGECQNRFQERKKSMKKIGFKSINQYLEWRKVMGILIAKKDFKLQ